MEKPLSSADVPPQFLRAALLVGSVPFKALGSDPRVSYGVYIPPKHYGPNPTATANGGASLKKLPLLINVHGTGRDVSVLFRELVAFAEETPCAVLAPLFPTGIDGPNDIDSYKTLRSRTLSSDLALLSILDEVAHRWPGIETRKVFMAGFSGGGQFVNRFLYLYPERLAAVSVGAPGRPTFMDDQQPWPKGVADIEAIFHKNIEKDLVRKVPIHLIVGGADREVHGGKEFWAWVKQYRASHKNNAAKLGDKEPNGLPPMDQGRLTGVQNLYDSWKRDGIEAQFDIVDGVAHERSKVLDTVLGFLQPLLRREL